jgi:hypothetical protein
MRARLFERLMMPPPPRHYGTYACFFDCLQSLKSGGWLARHRLIAI